MLTSGAFFAERHGVGTMIPGLYSGMSADRYHSIDAVSQSRLKVLKEKSALHLRYLLDHPFAPTDAMRLGAAIHDAVLLPDVFA